MNPLSQDAAIPQGVYLELWESTRFRQDQPQEQQQQLNQDHVQSYHQDVNVQNQNPDVGENPAHYNPEPAQRAPTWLSTALSRQPNPAVDSDQNPTIEACPACSSRGSCMCSSTAMHGGGASSSTAFLDQSGYANWLGAGIGSSSQFEHSPAGKLESDLQFRHQAARMATELNLSAGHGRENAPPQGTFPDLGQQSRAGDQPSYTGEFMTAEERAAKEHENWEELRRRCLIVTHPRYQEMLERHAECLRVGTPVDQLPAIEAQLEKASTVTEKYRALRDQIAEITPDEQAELDHFMSQYPPMLGGFRDTLQDHVYTHVTEAMMSCWELEQSLIGLTGCGVRLEDGFGATMSDEEEDYDSDYGSYDQGIDYNDSGGFGPLVPTETERTLMERVRQELKHELKQGYKSKIEDVREEILRKRRAGKLPEGTTTVLKAWWQAHSKWPYPTEDEKEVLIQETGLELKQVNNWFINQRKRNWHSNPLATAQASDSGKNKARKSW